MTDSITLPGAGSLVGVDAGVTMPDTTTADVQFVERYRQLFQTPWQDLTVTTGSAYASNDVVGGLIDFGSSCARRSGGSGSVKNYLLIDEDGQFGGSNLLLFSAAPSVTPVDHTLWAPTLADMKLCVGALTNSSGNFDGTAAISSMAGQNYGEIDVPYVCGTTHLFGVLIVAVGSPNWTHSSAVHVALVLDRD